VNIKKLGWLTLGFLLLIIGIIGRFVPLMGSTGPIIGAGYCFSRSSKRMEAWLLNTPFFGDYIRHYRYKTGVRMSIKIISISMMWTGMITTMFLLNAVWVPWFLLALGTVLTWHILSIKPKELAKKEVLKA